MRNPLFIIGALLLLLGIASLFVPFPIREKHGIEAGDLELGVSMVRHVKVHPAISAVLIGGGVALMVLPARRARRRP